MNESHDTEPKVIYKNGMSKEELLAKNAEKDRIVMNVEKGKKEKLFAQAKSKGYKFTTYVMKLIDDDRDKPAELKEEFTLSGKEEELIKAYRAQSRERKAIIDEILGIKNKNRTENV